MFKYTQIDWNKVVLNKNKILINKNLTRKSDSTFVFIFCSITKAHLPCDNSLYTITAVQLTFGRVSFKLYGGVVIVEQVFRRGVWCGAVWCVRFMAHTCLSCYRE